MHEGVKPSDGDERNAERISEFKAEENLFDESSCEFLFSALNMEQIVTGNAEPELIFSDMTTSLRSEEFQELQVPSKACIPGCTILSRCSSSQ